MSVEQKIDVNFDKEKFEKLGKDTIERAMELTTIDYHSRIIEEAPVDQGQLRGSWQLEQVQKFAWRVFSNAQHAAPIAFGRGPDPNLPWAPIAEWAGRKGIPPFPVYYKIKTEGTSANPYHERAKAKTKEKVQSFIDMALKGRG